MNKKIDSFNNIDLEIFKKKIKEIKNHVGRHTELISLYIPNGTDRSSIMNQLTQEISQSSNIKSPTTRKNVQTALKKLIQFLKVTDFNIPKTGLVLFSGNVSKYEGRPDVNLYHIVPIKGLNVKLYRCDSSFYTKPLEDMIEPDNIYGFIVIDNKEATIAVLSGKKYSIIGHLTSAVPGKIKAGGQSARRFERLRIDAANDFYMRISERLNKELLPYLDKIKGIIIGGPGNSKQKMVNRELIDYRLRQKILGFVDITYTNESGIKELIDSSDDLLKNTELKIEQRIIKEFLNSVATTNLTTYGIKEVLEALNDGRVDKLIISEKFEWNMKEYVCKDCNKKFYSLDVKTKCPFCKSTNVEILENLEPIDYFYEESKKTKTKIYLVSDDTNEGQQFFIGFGGLGAILRY